MLKVAYDCSEQLLLLTRFNHDQTNLGFTIQKLPYKFIVIALIMPLFFLAAYLTGLAIVVTSVDGLPVAQKRQSKALQRQSTDTASSTTQAQQTHVSSLEMFFPVTLDGAQKLAKLLNIYYGVK